MSTPASNPSVLAELLSDASPESAALFTDLAAGYFADAGAGLGPVSAGRTPAELDARFREPMPRSGRSLGEVVARLARDVMPDANRLVHPMYVGHQVSAPLPAAVWTEPLVAALNQSLAVREMSPTASAVESTVIRWLCDAVGFGGASGGTLTSGGTEATFAALLAARSHAIPDVWRDGIGDDPPVVVCGEHAHYAVSRAVGEMGLGLRNVVPVPSRAWAMDVAALGSTLDRLTSEGRRVMAVVATAGSTATGSFDDLHRIADICDAHDLWLHVDGAHGASALLSGEHRHRLAGLERARSLAWDPHKMMLLPLSAGVVLVRDERDLERAFAQQAPYLFHGDDEGERNPDAGVRSFQCSRRADALKLWVAFQRHGADGLGALYDHLCATARSLHARLEAHPRFVTLHAPESNILCFRWTGPADLSLGDERLDEVNRALRERYNRSGAGWITATNLGGRRVLRVTVMNPRTGEAELERLVAGLDAEGEKLTASI